MTFSPAALWRKDTALHTYIFIAFVIGLPFTLLATYVIYQIQVIGFLLGTDSEGLPCTTYCLVPFGSKTLDLNSVILYLNAMGLGIGGFLSLIISAYADYFKNKSNIFTFFVVLYGIFAIPCYWLRDYTLKSFNALMGIYVAYAIITYIISALLCIYIPHCMRVAGEKELAKSHPTDSALQSDHAASSLDTKALANDSSTSTEDVESVNPRTPNFKRKYGFFMSIMGAVSTALAGAIALVVTIIVMKAVSVENSQSAGLLITTIVGFITILGAGVAYFGLPHVPSKDTSGKGLIKWGLQVFVPFKDLARRKNMCILLLSFTIFNDVLFAMSSVTGQLFFIEVEPDALEISLYSFAGLLFQIAGTLGYFFLQAYKPPFRLEYMMIFGYALVLIVPIWGCIGLKSGLDFGFKNKWEFYVQNFFFNLSVSIVAPTFRVIFAEMIPKGSEIEWFGLQVVLSCATAWVAYVANAPLQNATHELRFPLILCLIFLLIPVVLEVLRVTLPVFKRDRIRWEEFDAKVVEVVES